MQSKILLKKFGLSEDDINASRKLFSELPLPPPPGNYRCKKQERVLGYRTLTLKREKALRLLGASEVDIEIENSKNLGSLGLSGRRRSFVVINPPEAMRTQTFFNCFPNGCGYNYQKSNHPKRPSRIRKRMESNSLKRRAKTKVRNTSKKSKNSNAYPNEVDGDEIPSLNLELTKFMEQTAQQLEILRLKKKVKQLETELLKGEFSKNGS